MRPRSTRGRWSIALLIGGLCALGACSDDNTAPKTSDAGGGGGLIPPGQSACCSACKVAGQPCQANGCYNGYFCNAALCKCLAPPVQDGGNQQRDTGTSPKKDGAPTTGAVLRITEINPAGHDDLIELVAVEGGALKGVKLVELTNSGFSYSFPSSHTVTKGDVILLHCEGTCSDSPDDRASCGSTAPYSASAWDLIGSCALSYSGKVLELLDASGKPMDGVPFVESHGAEPDAFVAAVKKLQSEGVWAATPACVHDPSTGLAKDRYCRNISVLWDTLTTDKTTSVSRLGGAVPLAIPGSSAQWSAALPATWGTY